MNIFVTPVEVINEIEGTKGTGELSERFIRTVIPTDKFRAKTKGRRSRRDFQREI